MTKTDLITKLIKNSSITFEEALVLNSTEVVTVPAKLGKLVPENTSITRGDDFDLDNIHIFSSTNYTAEEKDMIKKEIEKLLNSDL